MDVEVENMTETEMNSKDYDVLPCAFSSLGHEKFSLYVTRAAIAPEWIDHDKCFLVALLTLEMLPQFNWTAHTAII